MFKNLSLKIRLKAKKKLLFRKHSKMKINEAQKCVKKERKKVQMRIFPEDHHLLKRETNFSNRGFY